VRQYSTDDSQGAKILLVDLKGCRMWVRRGNPNVCQGKQATKITTEGLTMPKTFQLMKGLSRSTAFVEVQRILRLRKLITDFRGFKYDPKTGKAKIA